jgi:hypothetical protein
MIKIRRKISQKIMGRQSSALSKRIFKNMWVSSNQFSKRVSWPSMTSSRTSKSTKRKWIQSTTSKRSGDTRISAIQFWSAFESYHTSSWGSIAFLIFLILESRITPHISNTEKELSKE